MNIYNPSGTEKRFLGVEPFYWLYASGIEIIREYGDIFLQHILPDVNYLIISKTEKIQARRVTVISDKWGKLSNGKVYPECLKEDAWSIVHDRLKYKNQPVKINGKEFIIAYPIDRIKIPFLYSRSSGNLFPVLRLTDTSNPRLSKIFEVMDEELGDWSKFYRCGAKELAWHGLNILPCGEFAHVGLVEYCVARGYDIKFSLPKFRNISNKRNYIVLKCYLDDGESFIVVPNRWELRGDAHKVWEPWMDEDDSLKYMVGRRVYTGCRGMLGGKRCMIITFPSRIYNPVIWDVDSNTVFTLPSRAYPGDKYYKQIVSYFGEIY